MDHRVRRKNRNSCAEFATRSRRERCWKAAILRSSNGGLNPRRRRRARPPIRTPRRSTLPTAWLQGWWRSELFARESPEEKPGILLRQLGSAHEIEIDRARRL